MPLTGKFIGPPRIWTKADDIPGLMMSRSFGDEIGHSCGIICTPGTLLSLVVKEFARDGSCVCLVVGSDGAFEMMPEGAIASICHKYLDSLDAESAAKEISQTAFHFWNKNMMGYVDDITCIVIYLNPPNQA